MFTGLIEGVGLVSEAERTAAGLRLRIASPLADDLRPGDSVAVNGVCLTAVAASGGHAAFEVGPETARVTTLASLRPGRPVNLERSMPAGGRFGGHFVQGHVDATGTVRAVVPDGDAHWLTVGFEERLAPFLVPKGSVAVDGVSLTVAELEGDAFRVMIVPYTWTHTALRSLANGDAVNVECDLLGKYVVRAVEVAAARAAAPEPTAPR